MSDWPWDSTKEEKLVSGRKVYQLLIFAGRAEGSKGKRGPYAMQSAPSCSGSPASSTHSPAEHCAR
jgi:hypothetical protein